MGTILDRLGALVWRGNIGVPGETVPVTTSYRTLGKPGATCESVNYQLLLLVYVSHSDVSCIDGQHRVQTGKHDNSGQPFVTAVN